MIIMVIGGIKSGKSSFAIKYALGRGYRKKAFIATGVPFDEEMKEKIEKHKRERSELFDTFEEPIDVISVLDRIDSEYDVAIFDCLTTYLGNLYHYQLDVESYINSLMRRLNSMKTDIIIVTNEVGLSIVPESKLARSYAETLSRINATLAQMANEVYLMIAGIDIRIK